MALPRSFRGVATETLKVCRQCRRTFASSERGKQRQTATGGLADDLMQSFRSQTSTPQRPPNPAPTATTTSPSDPSASAEAGAPRPRSAHDIASSSIQAIAESEARKKRQRALEEMQLPYTRQDLERQMPRRWKVGDVYAPHDLTGVEASKWKKYQRKGASNIDMLDQLGINPLMEFRNIGMMSEFVTETGRIKSRSETGFRPKNQRRMAKAVRRAVALGFIPSSYQHPEILKREMDVRRNRY